MNPEQTIENENMTGKKDIGTSLLVDTQTK